MIYLLGKLARIKTCFGQADGQARLAALKDEGLLINRTAGLRGLRIIDVGEEKGVIARSIEPSKCLPVL